MVKKIKVLKLTVVKLFLLSRLVLHHQVNSKQQLQAVFRSCKYNLMT